MGGKEPNPPPHSCFLSSIVSHFVQTSLPLLASIKGTKTCFGARLPRSPNPTELQEQVGGWRGKLDLLSKPWAYIDNNTMHINYRDLHKHKLFYLPSSSPQFIKMWVSLRLFSPFLCISWSFLWLFYLQKIFLRQLHTFIYLSVKATTVHKCQQGASRK